MWDEARAPRLLDGYCAATPWSDASTKALQTVGGSRPYGGVVAVAEAGFARGRPGSPLGPLELRLRTTGVPLPCTAAGVLAVLAQLPGRSSACPRSSVVRGWRSLHLALTAWCLVFVEIAAGSDGSRGMPVDAPALPVTRPSGYLFAVDSIATDVGGAHGDRLVAMGDDAARRSAT